MKKIIISYNKLCDILFRSGCSLHQGLREIYPRLNEDTLSRASDEIKKRFLPHFNKKKREFDHSKLKFYKRYAQWLEGELVLDLGTSSVEILLMQ